MAAEISRNPHSSIGREMLPALANHSQIFLRRSYVVRNVLFGVE